MDRLPELSADGLIERTRGEFERLMREVAAAVNAAPEGRVINGSEEQVRDLLGEFRRGVYHTVHSSTSCVTHAVRQTDRRHSSDSAFQALRLDTSRSS